jgi:hypothetical protein
VVAGGAGQTVLRYLGKASGKQTFYGPITGARYAAGSTHPMIAVDDRDLYGPNPRQAGMLERIENGIRLFRVEPQAQKPTPIPVPVETPVEAVESKAEVFQDWKGEAEPEAVPVVAVDIASMSVAAVKKLELTQAQWVDLQQAEIAGRNRKSVLVFIEGKLDV